MSIQMFLSILARTCPSNASLLSPQSLNLSLQLQPTPINLESNVPPQQMRHTTNPCTSKLHSTQGSQDSPIKTPVQDKPNATSVLAHETPDSPVPDIFSNFLVVFKSPLECPYSRNARISFARHTLPFSSLSSSPQLKIHGKTRREFAWSSAKDGSSHPFSWQTRTA